MIRIVKYECEFSFECVYQVSKVFECGGLFVDLLNVKFIEVKCDLCLNLYGCLIKFRFFGIDWFFVFWIVFYDWLYINVFYKYFKFVEQVFGYCVFLDIVFNLE